MATYNIFVVLVALYVFSFHGSRASSEAKAPSTDPFRVDLIRRDRAVQHYTSQDAQSSYIPVNYVEGVYLMQMEIGSPVPLNLHFILDTGSDLIWTQCKPCNITLCKQQSDPMYDPFQSSSYTNLSCSSPLCLAIGTCDNRKNCDYDYEYDSGSTTGVLAEETFSFPISGSRARNHFPHLKFGCGRGQDGDFLNSSGIVGLGRGPLSLVSQIGSSFDNIFSYCLGSVSNASEVSPLFLGPSPNFGAVYSGTPLIQNNGSQTFYYLGLDGISVAGELVSIPKGTFEIQADGSGGLFIDSGTFLTNLEAAGYTPFLDAVRSSITTQPVSNTSATVGFDLCYVFTPSLVFPNITFHFAGGADYVLPPENSFISDQRYTDGLVCLAFQLSQLSGSIFGNFMQQNFHIVYDLGRNELSFAPAKCAAI